MNLRNKYCIICAFIAITGCHIDNRKNGRNPQNGKIDEKAAVNRSNSDESTNIANDIARNPWFAESAKGRTILAAVERGEPQALNSYPRLRDTVNAQWTEDLDMAVAEALLHNPEAVLAIADTVGKLNTFCASPLIEPQAGVEQAFLRAALKSLRSIRSESPMARRRDACVARLRSLMRG